MNKRELLKQLERGKIQPVYLFTGEPYLVTIAIEKVREKIFPDKGASGIEIFYSDECEIDEVIKSIKNISLFSDKKMIIIKRAEALTKDKIEAILPFVENPPVNTFIIFVASSEMKNRSLSEVIAEKYNSVVSFPEYKKVNELRDFIMEELEDAGFRIDYDAVNLLLELSGSSLFNIKNEIEKLKISCKDKKNISSEDVEENVFADIKDDFFGILNGICERNAALVMKSFRSVIKKDYEYLGVMSSVATYIMGLYTIRRLIDSGLSEEEIFIKSGERNRFSFNRKFQGAQNYTAEELYDALKRLSELDILLKSSAISRSVLFDDFFLSFCRRGGTNFLQG